jgi:hypothetical protein
VTTWKTNGSRRLLSWAIQWIPTMSVRSKPTPLFASP